MKRTKLVKKEQMKKKREKIKLHKFINTLLQTPVNFKYQSEFLNS